MAMGGWELAKDTVKGFIADEALSHGASIAYYTLFAVAPVLLIIIAIAALVFGQEAARGRHRRPAERPDGRIDGEGARRDRAQGGRP